MPNKEWAAHYGHEHIIAWCMTGSHQAARGLQTARQDCQYRRLVARCRAQHHPVRMQRAVLPGPAVAGIVALAARPERRDTNGQRHCSAQSCVYGPALVFLLASHTLCCWAAAVWHRLPRLRAQVGELVAQLQNLVQHECRFKPKAVVSTSTACKGGSKSSADSSWGEHLQANCSLGLGV